MFYTLNLVCEDPELRQVYESAAAKHNAAVDRRDEDPTSLCCDAGFDLHVPDNVEAKPHSTTKIGHQVYCSMECNCSGSTPMLCGYYLYPRSSTGTKTPLRLANSVGIIDAGYRGEIIAALDNTNNDWYTVERRSRLVQICPPNITFPLRVCVLSSREQLNATERGAGGFGSTGK